MDLQNLLHAILTCVTAGPGLGFNRAVLFLTNEARTELRAAMAIGPASPEEAHLTWTRLANEQKSLRELLDGPPAVQSVNGFQTVIEGLSIPLTDQPRFVAGVSGPVREAAPTVDSNPLLEAYRARHVVKIVDAGTLRDIPAGLREVFAGSEVVCVPLLAKEHVVGLIIADNAFSREPIGDDRIRLLELLALLAGLALDNARVYREAERQARQLQDALDQLKAAQGQLLHTERLAAIGSVVARVSHELRNPLATIGGFARVVSAHPGETERVARNAHIIVDEVEKLEVLLKEMLDFASPRPPVMALTNLTRSLNALGSVHQHELASRGVSLALELDPHLPGVLADQNQMPRVFLNLWQNAVQAMEETPAEHPRILTVRTWRDGDRVMVVFSDTGRGIPADVVPHIFTPFFTTKQHGTGLGLAVVKKIVGDHRGSIEVRSELGRGATFIISLPVAG